MSIVRWNPIWDPFAEMEDMMNRLPAVQGQSAGLSFVPAVNLYETKDAVVVESALAGIDPKEVEVSVEKGILTISGSSKKEHEVEEKNYYRKEVRAGSFYRQVPLPTTVKEDGVEAVFEDGLLKITCPKEITKTSKKVTVQIKKNNK